MAGEREGSGGYVHVMLKSIENLPACVSKGSSMLV